VSKEPGALHYHSLDADGTIVRINDTELSWLGYTRAEVEGTRRLSDLLTPSSRAVFLAGHPEFCRTGSTLEVEHEFIRKDGSILPVLVRASVVRDAAGNFVQASSSLFDITARKRAEAALRESEERFTLAVAATRDGIWDWNLETDAVWYSPRYKEMLGYAEDEIEHHASTWLRLMHPEDRAQALASVEAVLRGERDYELEFRMLHKAGHYLDILSRGVLVRRKPDGRVVRIVGTHFDLTERKQAEAAVRQSRDALEAANAELQRAARMKDDFLANMSHELRTPLNAVLGLSEALQEAVYGPLAERQQKPLRQIEESGRHLLGLINDILDLSKIEAGKIELEVGSVTVAELCQASLQFVRQAALKKRQAVTAQYDPAVTVLLADERRLKQILVNLLTNAMKFTPEGGAFGLEVQGDPERQAVRCTVWDTGIGIDAEDQARLFQPFVQLDSSLSRQHAGTGLGLALVQRLAALHGGSVELDSAPGQGSRFTVWLPWRVPGAPAPAAPDPAGAAPAAALVVEDTAAHAEQLVRYLAELDIRATVATAGGGVVAQAAATHPDVILLDLGLPDVSGWTVLAQLQAESRTQAIPVVVVTVADAKAQARAAGAAAYLQKPVTRGELQAALRQAVGARPQHTALVVPAPAAPLLLLAEDNPENVATLGDYLRAKGYRLAVAKDGLEALALAHRERPALILMDVQMPGLDGLEATRRLRADPDPALAQVPILALTALAMAGDEARCLAAGATAYMAKPVRLKELAETVATLLAPEAL
jgi:PAS domain S-box-containing protein